MRASSSLPPTHSHILQKQRACLFIPMSLSPQDSGGLSPRTQQLPYKVLHSKGQAVYICEADTKVLTAVSLIMAKDPN